MNRIYIYFTSIFLMVLFTNTVFAKIPENLTCAKRAIINYYDSGEYEKDVNLVVQDAEQYLQKRIQENNSVAEPQKLAIVFDIDDTSLSNFLGNKKRDFSGLPELIEESYHEANAPAIKPVLHLYNEAIKNGVTVFFISFRPDDVRSYTITNLQKSGFYGWSELYLPNNEEIKLPAQTYKTAVREMLTKNGYDIILNLGDQDSDLNGGYAEHVDKIPNPLYSTSKTCEDKACL
jgi:predicted secreted acid phosphatase